MFYTYILESLADSTMRYIGHTSDVVRRLSEHNEGKSGFTKKYKPWKLKFYAAFETRIQAEHFEQYLKSGSGHAFAKRHFWVT